MYAGMNGANIYLPHALGIDSRSSRDALVLGLINSGMYLSVAACGAWISDPVNKRVGRRGAISLASALALVGNAGSAASMSWPVLFFFRLILGAGLGLNASTVAVYAAESAPAAIRGGLSVSWQMFTAFGILLGFVANVLVRDLDENLIWRLQLAAPLVPTIPLLLLVYLCAESPAWEAKRSRYDLAFACLARLRNTELEAAREMYSTYLSQQRANRSSNKATPSFIGKLASLYTDARNRHALFASYTVMLSQQLCGINIISFYSSIIFSSTGFSDVAALWASVVFGVINFLGAIPAIWTMDSLGRRRLLLWTLPPMAVTMALASLTFALTEGTVQFFMLAALIYLFCAIYSPGMGPVPFAYSAEVFPSNVRDVGMSFAIATANSWATVLSVTFPALLAGLGQRGSFGIYAVLNVVAFVLCWLSVRETKGVQLEEMDKVFAPSVAAFVKEKWTAGPGSWMNRARARSGWTQVTQDEDVD